MIDIAHASKSENKIVKRLLAAILKAKCTVTVYDGEDCVITKSRAKGVIIAALGSTDHDVLHIYHPDGKLGFILLIWGNGEDVISDYSDNDTIRKFVCYAQGEPFNQD